MRASSVLKRVSTSSESSNSLLAIYDRALSHDFIQRVERNRAEPVQHTEADREAGSGDPHDFQHSRVPQLLGDTHVVELGRDELIVRLDAPERGASYIGGGLFVKRTKT